MRETNNPQRDQLVFFDTTTMDTENFVPIERKSEMIDKARDPNRRLPSSRERYVWKDFGGVMVPTEIHSDPKTSMRKVGKLKYYAKRTVDVTAHWFSVNEEFPENSFDHKVFEDFDQLIKLTDPSASNAKSLMKKKQ